MIDIQRQIVITILNRIRLRLGACKAARGREHLAHMKRHSFRGSGRGFPVVSAFSPGAALAVLLSPPLSGAARTDPVEAIENS
jgi:hypothetical protein